MFDFGWDEMALIAVVSLIVIGPKDLPHVLRQAGRWARKAREMAGDFQRGVEEMVRESELKDLRQQVEKAADTSDLRRKVEAALDPEGEIARGLAPPVDDLVAETELAEEIPPELPVTAPLDPPSRPPVP